jgi:tRNA threonylcarbamoyl adenosine modification protein YjeE
LNTLLEFECDLLELNSFAKKLATKTLDADIFLLKGELGVGKTTFARSFINSLFDKHKIKRPGNIKSPSFPIMINYPMLDYEINHYDLYRLINERELLEIGFFEDIEKNISIIEWPDIIIKNSILTNYYLIEFDFRDLDKRSLKLQHSIKKYL